ncbi:hypothetical protein CYMTET_23789 [Cymbomonas tetramitiformis]|uniref:RING-CH-type domain-containing protein n=1 Tax=Cymbomonas tetramitiformis TaxID=36881 RepID=A0AAE0FXE2_9CHLO|nr:hypothetical protein CYMTET_23789 [Cymbomonas tetramitiformis]
MLLALHNSAALAGLRHRRTASELQGSLGRGWPLSTEGGALPRARPASRETTPHEFLCRICYGGDEEVAEKGELVCPCACRGSNKYIHITCLKQWHLTSGSRMELQCPTCKQRYFGVVAVQLARMTVEKVTAEEGEDGLGVANALNNLGALLSDMGTYDEAEALHSCRAAFLAGIGSSLKCWPPKPLVTTAGLGGCPLDPPPVARAGGPLRARAGGMPQLRCSRGEKGRSGLLLVRQTSGLLAAKSRRFCRLAEAFRL